MAQQIQFVYLAQSEYDALTKQGNILYFTSDTHRIYRGTELYATTSFDTVSAQSATFGDLTVTGNVSMSLSQVEFGRIQASEITIDGSSVSLEGHTHPASDISGLDEMMSGYASASHSHAISDITNLSTILEGITQSEVSKSRVSASAGVFDQISAESATFSSITVQVADFTTTRVSAQVMTVGGSNVSVEGHTHAMSDIEGLESISSAMSGITESEISKTSATFQDLVVTGDVTFSVDQLDFQSLTASSILVNGSSVALEGHGHSASDISDLSDAVVSAGTSVFASASHSHDGLQGLTSSSISKDSASFNSIGASTATFDNLVVTGDVSLSLSQVQFGSIVASDISVNGSSVALEGHTHVMSDIEGLSELGSSISAMAAAMSGISESSISKTSATFQDLVVTGEVTFSVDQLDFQSLTASSILVDGKSVSLEGHLHSFADVDGLSSHVSQVTASISAFGDQLQGITSSGISKSTATFGDLTITGELTCSLDQVQFGSIMASEISVNGSSVALEGHTHSTSDITGLNQMLSGYALSNHSHAISDVSELTSILSGITSSTIDKEAGTFDNIVASSATFGDITVSGDATLVVTEISTGQLTVGGSQVSLEGHVHVASEITDLASFVSDATSGFASTGHSHVELSGITSSSIYKDTATFGNLIVTGDVTMSLSEVAFGSIVASDISVNGSQVSLEGHVHGMSEIDGLESSISQLNSSVSAFASAMSGLDATSISKSSATFGDLVVTGSVTFSADQLDFDTLTASTILLNGSSVAVEGHLHSMSEIQGLESSISQVNASISTFSNALQGIEPTSISKSTATFGDLTVTGSLTLSLDELQFGSIMASEITVNGSSVSLEGHLHSIPDISGLSSILSGITESSIWKNQVSASAATFDQVTADVGNFRLISVSGSANFAVNNVSASSVSVNGTPVSLEGHVHTMSQITGLESYVQAFAAYESRIAALESMVSGLEQALHSINTGA